MKYPKFSVLMSLYIKEKANYLQQCMESLFRQTILPNEIVIVYDGPVTHEVNEVVEIYRRNYPDIIHVVKNKENKGLGPALADGVLACKYDLIARMDTDDIAREDRFEKQLYFFVNNPGLDICGSHIIEFEGKINNELSRRMVPLTHKDIAIYQKERSAFNHVTVMFRKKAVIDAGNYEDCPLMEDDMLWIRMLQSGATCCNVDDFLVYVRTGKAMIMRRGGWDYYKKYKEGRRRIYKTGYISYVTYMKTLAVQFIVANLPAKIRLFIFTHLLR